MLIYLGDNWSAARHEHTQYLAGLLNGYLKDVPRRPSFCWRVWQFVNKIKCSLLTGSQKDIAFCIAEFEWEMGRLRTKKRQKLFRQQLAKIFDYASFRTKKPGWDAYKLCKKSLARTCSYCNQAYAFTVQLDQSDGKGRGARPTLDHFYAQDHYPHLALVLNNLIPACASCNSSLKLAKNFHSTPHLHPFFDPENIRLSLAPAVAAPSLTTMADLVLADTDDLTIVASALHPCDKTKESINTFLLSERYEMVVPEAVEFARLKIEYDEAEKNFSQGELAKHLKESHVLRFKRDDYRRYLLGRLFADLYDVIQPL